ncbi:CPBP family intramembrane glutamic endopeptidase [Candidatus Enterococcus lemimoniae]|uniref:CAAX prenyl protease 2/Lysostaphin resistance protein A-like domain-containing protein n=1 Tax=Candidatus Enterococcus lemimoniae TaxID=1834167 RepID=A0ABZ2T5G0_9ENTE
MSTKIYKIIYIVIYLFIKKIIPAVGASWDIFDSNIILFQNLFLVVLGCLLFKQDLINTLKNALTKKTFGFVIIITFTMYLIDISYAMMLSKPVAIQYYSYGFLAILQSSIIIPFIEELVYRYCFINLKGKTSVQFLWIIFSSILFSSGHLASVNYNLISLIPVFVSSLFVSYVYVYKKNIWYNIFSHSLYNFLIFGYAYILALN